MYQTYLVKWFRLWGWELKPTEPTLLDLAILQTNLFFTQSSRFHNGFDDNQWAYAFQRLCTGIMHYDISGLLITSKEVGDRFIEATQKPGIPGWNRAIGEVSSWSERSSDTLQLTTTKTAVLSVAIMNHYASGVADDDVQSDANKRTMHAWIGDVLQEYKRNQFAEQSSPPYNSPAIG
ncbi:MAG: hypothetical protein EOM20_12890 [Spartobacteria bacterium]|nr:hypothetical protein [Spartobacteria bacterium]